MIEIFAGLAVLAVILFVPGAAISLAVFPPHRKEIDEIERFVLSFAFSIGIIPLVMIFENFLGVPINSVSATVNILLICGISIGYFYKTYPKEFTELIQETKKKIRK